MSAVAGISYNEGWKASLGRFYRRNRSITAKFSSAVMDQAVFAGSNFVLNVLLARWMPIESYGAFVVAYSWFLLLLNYYEAILIEPMAIFGAGKYADHFQKYLGFMYAGHVVISAGISLLFVIVAGFVHFLDSPMVAQAMFGAGIAAPFIMARWLTRQPFYIMSKPHWSTVGGAVYLVVALVGVVTLHQIDVMNAPQIALCAPPDAIGSCVTFPFDRTLTPFSALLLMGFGNLIASTVLTVFLIKPDLKLADGVLKVRDIMKDHWEYGKWSTGTRFLTWLLSNIYYIVLPLMVGLAGSAALKAIANLTLPIFMAMGSVTAVLTPIFVRAYEKEGKSGVDGKVKKYALMSIFLTGAYFIIVSALGQWVVHILYAGQFDEIVTLPIIMAMAAIPMLTVVARILNSAIRAMGGVKKVFISKLPPTILTLTMGMVLLYNFGLLGAQVSSVITSSVSVFILWRYYQSQGEYKVAVTIPTAINWREKKMPTPAYRVMSNTTQSTASTNGMTMRTVMPAYAPPGAIPRINWREKKMPVPAYKAISIAPKAVTGGNGEMISVIMPAYNAEAFIGEALDSILNQSYQNFEIIVVDDGSTDNTLKVLDDYKQKDDRIRVIQNDHGGACKARNTAIAAARYPWIAAMDADDVAHPQRFEKQLAAAEKDPDVVVWGAYLNQINLQGEVMGQIRIGPTSVEEFNAVDRNQHAIIVTNSTAMFRREIALKAGCYDERLPAAQDTEFWDRMANYGPVVVLPEPLVNYRLHGSSISAKRFFDQRMLHDYVVERNRAKSEGKELAMEDYIAAYKSKPAVQRLFRYIHNKGRYYYRNTGVHLAQKNYPAALVSLSFSVVLSPKFATARVWNRFFPKRFVA